MEKCCKSEQTWVKYYGNRFWTRDMTKKYFQCDLNIEMLSLKHLTPPPTPKNPPTTTTISRKPLKNILIRLMAWSK